VKKVKVKFLPDNKTLNVKPETSLIQAAEKNNIIIDLPCAGSRKCGKCKIRFKEGASSPVKEEKSLLSKDELKKGIRLACLSKIVKKSTVYIPDTARLYPIKALSFSLKTKSEFKLSASILKITNKKPKGKIFGIGFDLGTTTISASLIDLSLGQEISRIESYNPQNAFGADIISRLEYIRKDKNNLIKLHKALIKKINETIKHFVDKENIKRKDIAHIVCVGNTFIQYMLVNSYPTGLLKLPFKTKFTKTINKYAKDLKINLNPSTIVTILPGIGKFIGSDISSVILSSGIYNTKGINLTIDLGTNSELVLSKNNKLLATSCACGPALEGGHISSGMMAKKGAIKSFSWKEDKLSYKTIGQVKPKGICGSGLIDIIAYLKAQNKISENGRLENSPFKITDNIKITQEDIRSFQLAKAAIRVGIILLLDKANIEIDKIKNVFIAGNFGNFTNPDNMIKSTLLPKNFLGKIKFIGNASLAGTEIILSSKNALGKIEKIANNTKSINLAEVESFNDEFVNAINFID